jgi:hypothetical protein
LFSAGSKRYYGPVDRPLIKIGRWIVFSALLAIVKGSCSVQTSDSQIEKAIREGINTLRLHDTQVKMRELKNRLLTYLVIMRTTVNLSSLNRHVAVGMKIACSSK